MDNRKQNYYQQDSLFSHSEEQKKYYDQRQVNSKNISQEERHPQNFKDSLNDSQRQKNISSKKQNVSFSYIYQDIHQQQYLNKKIENRIEHIFHLNNKKISIENKYVYNLVDGQKISLKYFRSIYTKSNQNKKQLYVKTSIQKNLLILELHEYTKDQEKNIKQQMGQQQLKYMEIVKTIYEQQKETIRANPMYHLQDLFRSNQNTLKIQNPQDNDIQQGKLYKFGKFKEQYTKKTKQLPLEEQNLLIEVSIQDKMANLYLIEEEKEKEEEKPKRIKKNSSKQKQKQEQKQQYKQQQQQQLIQLQQLQCSKQQQQKKEIVKQQEQQKEEEEEEENIPKNFKHTEDQQCLNLNDSQEIIYMQIPRKKIQNDKQQQLVEELDEEQSQQQQTNSALIINSLDTIDSQSDSMDGSNLDNIQQHYEQSNPNNELLPQSLKKTCLKIQNQVQQQQFIQQDNNNSKTQLQKYLQTQIINQNHQNYLSNKEMKVFKFEKAQISALSNHVYSNSIQNRNNCSKYKN